MGKEAVNAKVRTEFLTTVSDMISEKFNTDVMQVSSSEITFPWINSEGDEIFVKVKISVPRGTRNGEGYDAYDGYAAAEDYKLDCEERTAKKEASEEKKRKKIEADEKKRAEKKALAEANKNLKELKNIKITPEE